MAVTCARGPNKMSDLIRSIMYGLSMRLPSCKTYLAIRKKKRLNLSLRVYGSSRKLRRTVLRTPVMAASGEHVRPLSLVLKFCTFLLFNGRPGYRVYLNVSDHLTKIPIGSSAVSQTAIGKTSRKRSPLLSDHLTKTPISFSVSKRPPPVT